jgi:hypothetical protein
MKHAPLVNRYYQHEQALRRQAAMLVRLSETKKQPAPEKAK